MTEEMNYTMTVIANREKFEELLDFGQIDGSQHKAWVIDQMARLFLKDEYDEFVKEYKNDGEYEWDLGIAP